MQKIRFRKKKKILYSGLVTIIGGGLSTFIVFSLKLSHLPPVTPDEPPQGLKTLLKVANLAARAGIQSTENNLSPLYVMNYYGDQKYKFMSGVETTVKELWGSYFGQTNYNLARGTKLDQGISYGGASTPYSYQLLNTLDEAVIPVLNLLQDGFTAEKATLLKGLLAFKFSGTKIDVNTPFISRKFDQKIESAFDISWACDRHKNCLTYDQIWVRKVPLIICNFLTSIIKWPQVSIDYGWKSPVSFNLTHDNYNDQNPSIVTRIHRIMRIIIDDLIFKKGQYLTSLSTIVQNPNALKSLIRLLLFVGSYIHQFLTDGYNYQYQPKDSNHLFSADKDNNQWHQTVFSRHYAIADINLDEWGQLIDDLSVVHANQPKDYCNKLKIWNILFDNQVQFKEDRHPKYQAKIGEIKLVGLPIPISINWQDITSTLPNIKADKGQLHGFDSIWHAFTDPAITQLLVSAAGISRHYVKKISFVGAVDLPDTWLTIQHILDHLNVETVIPWLLNWLSQNKKGNIGNTLFANYEKLIGDIIDLFAKKNIHVLLISLSLDQFLPSIKQYEEKLTQLKLKLAAIVSNLNKWFSYKKNVGAFQDLYQGPTDKPKTPNILTILLRAFNPQAKSCNLETWLNQPISLPNNPILYYWHKQSISQISQYFSKLLHPKSSQQKNKIEIKRVKQLIDSMVGDPAAWAKKHPDVYDFEKEHVKLSSQTMLQYALRLWNYQDKPASGQKVGPDAAFEVLGLDNQSTQLTDNSVLQSMAKLYDGDGLKRTFNILLTIIKNIREGMRSDEQDNYVSLLTENHYTVKYDAKPKRDATHTAWLIGFVVSYYQTPQVLTSRYFYQLKFISRSKVTFLISQKL